MKKKKLKNWKRFGIEFVSIFIAVISAFALNNWNDNRKDNNSEDKILLEIANGLEKDLEDIKLNVKGHNWGISACQYFRDAIMGKNIDRDSIIHHFYHLTRDYVSIQNTAGYETLKSQGLEIIDNDSLRHRIISIYEYDYTILKNFEENYFEMQYQANYFEGINDALAPYFIFDESGNIISIEMPMNIQEDKKNKLLLYLWKIQVNREFILRYYAEIDSKIANAIEEIKDEIED